MTSADDVDRAEAQEAIRKIDVALRDVGARMAESLWLPPLSAFDRLAQALNQVGIEATRAGEAMERLAALWPTVNARPRADWMPPRLRMAQRYGPQPIGVALAAFGRIIHRPVWHPRVLALWIRSQVDLLPQEW